MSTAVAIVNYKFMCGIAGSISPIQLDRKIIKQTLKLMENRGPDNQSFVNYEYGNIFLHFLHSRLAIQDLDSRSNQPFFYENLVMLFNGEVYNFIELRSELEKLGYVFKSNSDTEVLLKLYMHYGLDFIDKVNGIFAFSIFDQKKRERCLTICYRKERKIP